MTRIQIPAVPILACYERDLYDFTPEIQTFHTGQTHRGAWIINEEEEILSIPGAFQDLNSAPYSGLL